MEDDGRGGRPPATDAQIAHLLRRLRVELGLTNAIGGAVLVLGSILFDPPAAEESGTVVGAFWSLALVVPAVVVGVWASHRLGRPLIGWLRNGEAGRPAPERVRMLVLAHPALQAVVLLALWLMTGLGIAVADAVTSAEEPLREFLTTLAGISTAGVVVAILSFLTTQRLLGPWYDRFFAGTDPTGMHVPSTRVGRRLLVVFALGTALPLLLVGGAVTERLHGPRSASDLEGIVWFLVAVGIGTGLALTLSVRQSIVRPLRFLRGAAERVRDGDVSVTVPVEAPDELGEVAVSFNAMVDGLRERRRLEDLFGRHVGGAVARRALEEGVALGGERREASVVFVDLEGFTRTAEDAPPEAVVSLLNRFFTVVVHEVDRHHGVVNKFMGDAVLAVFGAPLDDPDHARHALAAASSIADALAGEGMRFGIGVSTGELVAGNVGAEERLEYTVVGDPVNEASRLQDLTRRHDAVVLVSGRTAAAVGEHDGLVLLGQERLRGRAEPSEIYTLA